MACSLEYRPGGNGSDEVLELAAECIISLHAWELGKNIKMRISCTQ